MILRSKGIMKKVRIKIINVTGEESNEILLSQLAEKQAYKNNVFEGIFHSRDNTVKFTTRTPTCTGWRLNECIVTVGITCEILTLIPKNKLKPGMVFFCPSHPDHHAVLLKLYEDMALMTYVHKENQRQGRFSMGYGWFDCYYYIRTMRKKELKMYLEGLC